VRLIWKGTDSNPETEVRAKVKKENKGDFNPLHGLNEKARKSSAGDQVALNELVDDIMTQYGLLNGIPGAKEAVKDRIVRAEVRYQQIGKGISEQKLVKMINNLAQAFAAPEFMKTDIQQVRYMRVSRMVFMPNLINQRKHQETKSDTAINGEMSPVEAMYIAVDLVFQKLNVEDFQVTPREFRANANKRRQELWANRAASFQTTEKVFQMKAAQAPSKTEEVKETYRRVAAIKPAELNQLLDSMMSTLGIDK